MKPEIAIIGGTGLDKLDGIEWVDEIVPANPWGDVSGPVQLGVLGGREFAFLPRHGSAHRLAPHEINYRANIWALKHLEVKHIVAVNAVGGITAQMGPEVIAIPHQLIDYTWGRAHTFSEGPKQSVNHIDFTRPYSGELRERVLRAASELGLEIRAEAVYACTQGPRLETAAEILKLERDGCDIVGMTAMPEAALAAELDMQYAAVCLVVNWGAGKTSDLITMEEIDRVVNSGMGRVTDLLRKVLLSP